MKSSNLTILLTILVALLAAAVGFIATAEIAEAKVALRTHDTAPVPAHFADLNRLSQAGESEVEKIDEYQFMELMNSRRQSSRVAVIDVRSVVNFRKLNIYESVNLTVDQLHDELSVHSPEGGTIVVFCNYNKVCEQGHASRGILGGCQRVAQYIKHNLGYTDTMILAANESDLVNAGVRMSGTDALMVHSRTQAKNQ